ncbi:hypothetical protein GLE_2454 [Lysobacter enzymogenes]|uniref:Uncharacterized protein n=1 Tax=Lysobacter enzymogenes TaxID=69 RepID=A0A0S2DGU6_LYSEN|nr:hypothetical protein GLE_2454 [Lysobacter enzymogenes]
MANGEVDHGRFSGEAVGRPRAPAAASRRGRAVRAAGARAQTVIGGTGIEAGDMGTACMGPDMHGREAGGATARARTGSRRRGAPAARVPVPRRAVPASPVRPGSIQCCRARSN